jgi:hypothetical protein
MPSYISYSGWKDGLHRKTNCLRIAIENIFQKGKDRFR